MNKEYRIKNNASKTMILVAERPNAHSWVLLLLSAIAVMICFVFTREVFGQEASYPADPVRRFNITFPVSTLGNCNSLAECKAYCDDISNKEACEAFAKSKGFYKAPQSQGNARNMIILEKAKSELGCSSNEECKTFCQEKENHAKCREFAKKYGLSSERRAVNSAILERAKSVLGCDSEAACRDFCREEANREKCSSFARQAGLPGGMVKVATGSAKSGQGFSQVKQIMDKCAKDPEFCVMNIKQIELQIMEESEQFCETNPEKCKEFIRDLERQRAQAGEGEFDGMRPPSPGSDSGRMRPDTMPAVQGVSTSIFQQIWSFLFR